MARELIEGSTRVMNRFTYQLDQLTQPPFDGDNTTKVITAITQPQVVAEIGNSFGETEMVARHCCCIMAVVWNNSDRNSVLSALGNAQATSLLNYKNFNRELQKLKGIFRKLSSSSRRSVVNIAGYFTDYTGHAITGCRECPKSKMVPKEWIEHRHLGRLTDEQQCEMVPRPKVGSMLLVMHLLGLRNKIETENGGSIPKRN